MLDEANKLLAHHMLAALRLASWDRSRDLATFEVFHGEWPQIVFGELRFHAVAYLQCPTQLPWGYGVRLSPDATLPSRRGEDSHEVVFELFARDGAEPSAFVVASALECATEPGR